MKQAFSIRLLWLKKEAVSVLFWLFMPLIFTPLIVGVVQSFQEDVTIPVGLVIEEASPLTDQLVEQLNQADYLSVRQMNKAKALQLLEQHELDSVFVLRKNYEENLLSGNKRVIEGYASNRSYAYFAALEMVSSFAQEQASRGKLVNELEQLLSQNNRLDLWNKEAILSESIERQVNNDLIRIDFTLYKGDSVVTTVEQPRFIWAIWSLLTLLSTLFLFDWLVKERAPALQIRWTFSKLCFTHYTLWQLLFYSIVLFLFDLVMLFTQQPFSWKLILSLLAFRITINLFAFFIALLIKNRYSYYLSCIFITIISAVIGGGFIPLDGLVERIPAIVHLHPLYAFLNGQVAFPVLLISLILLALFAKKGGTLFVNH